MESMRKFRISIISLAAIEMIALFIGSIVLFIHDFSIEVNQSSVVEVGSGCIFLSFICLVQMLNVAWITSFNRKYPLIHVLWMIKEVILLFFFFTIGFYVTAIVWSVYFFIFSVIIVAQFVLWRVFNDKQKASSSGGAQGGERNSYERMGDQGQRI